LSLLSQIVKEAADGPLVGFNKTIEDAIQILRAEDARVGDFEIVGRLVTMEPSGEALVIGDLHGDLESLVHILRESNILQRMDKSDSVHLVFLGDYGDRGSFSSEVIWAVLKLKLHFPFQVILMRGNHEGPKDMIAYPNDLPSQLKQRFGKGWAAAYDRLFELFGCLYTSVLVRNMCLMVHGGPSEEVKKTEDLAYAHVCHPRNSVLEDVLWSDPSDSIEGVYPSPRGAGKLFGKDVTARFLKVFKVKILVRGHESCDDGFKIDHDGSVMTLFSRKGSPYFNAHGAYLDLRLSEQFRNATQLIPYVHEF
jgi:protein phosphatase